MIITIPLVIVMGILAWVLKPGKKPASHRRNAILATVIPTGVLAIAALAFQLFHRATGAISVSYISDILFIVGLGLIGAAIIAAVVFAARRNGEIAKGIGFGICIAVIAYVIEFGLLEWLGGV